MALTAEQQSHIEFETAREALRAPDNRKQIKLDALRMAQSIINENRRLTTASEASDVTITQVTEVANSLLAYIES